MEKRSLKAILKKQRRNEDKACFKEVSDDENDNLIEIGEAFMFETSWKRGYDFNGCFWKYLHRDL